MSEDAKLNPKADVRAAAGADREGMLHVIAATGLFPAGELATMTHLLDGYLEGTAGADELWATVLEQESPVGVAYYAPERMTSGTWNLYFIGVDPKTKGKGYGRALVAFVEADLAARGERLLLAETSGLAAFSAARAFYRSCGYEKEAIIREFYSAGEDKIVYSKQLQKQAE